MDYLDRGYIKAFEDEIYTLRWNEYSDYHYKIGKENLLPEQSGEILEVGEYEFNKTLVINTIAEGSNSWTRVIYFGAFEYGGDGQLLAGKIVQQYYFNFGIDDDGYYGESGAVRQYESGYYFDFSDYISSNKEYNNFLNSEHIIHEFESDEDESEWHGLGRNAFSDPAVSKYFQEGWHLNPFGNDFNSSKSSVYRLFNQNSGRYLFSSNQVEIDIITGMDWINEGIAYKSPDSDQETTALHRFNTNGNGHFYTANEYEKEILESTTSWTYEGVAFQVYSHKQASSVTGAIPVIRYLNTNSGVHLYSTSSIEQDILNTAPEWLYEGIAWYGTSV